MKQIQTNSNKFKQLVFVIFILFQAALFYGQVEKVSENSLESKLKDKIILFTKDPWISDYQVIKIKDDLDKINKSFDFFLPSRSENKIVTQSELEVKCANKHFKGKFDSEEDGNVIELMNDGYGVFGYATIEGEFYSVEVLDDKNSIILKHDRSRMPPEICQDSASHRIIKDKGKGNTHRSGPNTQDCRVKVLILYTQDAVDENSNVTSIALTAMSQTNTAFANSGINGRVINGPIILLNENALSHSLAENPQLNAKRLSEDPYVQNLRTLYKSDIIVLLHDFETGAGRGGVAPDLLGFANTNYPVAVVHVSFASNSRFTFAHEVGHLLNARHGAGDDTALPGRAHQFATSGNFRTTLMDNREDGAHRILNFSNPAINFNGVPTGLLERDNSFNVNTSFCTLADWINSYDLTLSGATSSSPGQYTTVFANVSVNRYPCTLNWYADPIPYATNLVKTETISSTGSSGGGNYSFYFPSIPNGSFYYITGKLIPASPYSPISSTISIMNNTYYKVILTDDKSKENDAMLLYPNPTYGHDLINIKMPFSGDKNGTLLIYSVNGEMILSINYEDYICTIDASKLLKGNYLIVDQKSNTKRQIEKF